MPFFDKRLEDITEADLDELVAERVAEGKTLEFKAARTGNRDSDRNEFLADISSFANSSGGHIVYGVREEQGVAAEICGIPDFNPDAQILRLQNLARDGIRHRIPNLGFGAVQLENGSHCLIIDIPKSWNPPHQVVRQNQFRFYGRHTNGKYLLDVDEIRTIVSLSSEISERIRIFRAARVAAIIANEAPMPLAESAKIILHIVPIQAFAGSNAIDLGRLVENPNLMIEMLGGGGSSRHNLDGYLLYQEPGDEYGRYVQVFRNGVIEIVELHPIWDRQGHPVLPSVSFDQDVFNRVRAAARALADLDIEPPVFGMLTLTGMRDWGMGVEQDFRYRNRTFDRDPIVCPEIVLETLEDVSAAQIRPMLDSVWNAAGWPGSVHYDQDGNWRLESFRMGLNLGIPFLVGM
ncbi:MAG: ATP-binding protein [Proteobacteria bacterium]|nr:ATP-binding protein [Pseudomonadota bacterium]